MAHIGLDLDGTLLDTAVRHKVALAQAAASLEVSLPHGFLDRYYFEKCEGISGKQVLLRNNIPRAEEVAKRWVEIVESPDLLKLDRLFPGVMETLSAMKKIGFNFTIVTVRQNQGQATKQIQAVGLAEAIDNVFVSSISIDGASPPSKSELTANLGINAVVGDSEVDEEWARQLGVEFLTVASGIRSRKFWVSRKREAFAYATDALQFLRSKQTSCPPL
jgi:phosphoglycolate phosphatase-like HAD superfamily hydrolase